MKKLLLLILVISMTLATIGCTQTASKSESSNDKLVVGCDAEPYSLSPLESAGESSSRIRRQICEGLFEINDAGEYIPLLAESWDWEDEVTLVFHLREKVKFSDGTPFTAADVLFSLMNGINNGTGSIFGQYLDTENTQIIDDHTIKIVFLEENSLCFDKFESQHFPVYNQKAYEADGNQFAYNIIGTGPYVLENWTTGESLTLKKNKNYWGEPAKCETVVFRFITEASQRTIELETGGIDINVRVGASDIEYFEDEKYSIDYYPGIFLRELFFNLNSETRPSPVQDLRVRQAIAYAFDTEALLETYYDGVGQVPTTNINPAYASIYEAGDEVLYAYNLEKAKELMQEAGYGDGFKLVILSDDTADNQDQSEILQAALGSIGIELEILIRNSTTWYDTVLQKSEWDLCWFSLGDASPVFGWMHFCGDRENFNMPDYTTWRNETFTNSLLEVKKTNDIQLQKELFRTMDQCMTEDLPMYTVYVPTNIVAMDSSIQGFEYRSGMLNVNQIYFD